MTMMRCGDVATGTDEQGRPVCIAHAGLHPGATTIAKVVPDLTGRSARCGCGKVVPSSTDLAFFSARGPGTQNDTCRVCRYTSDAHRRFTGELMDSVGSGKWPPNVAPHDFEPMTEGYEMDSWYCGHAGWD